MGTLARYTVELGRPQEGWVDLQRSASRARDAAAEMQQDGVMVRFLRSIFVPEDETCFFLFEGPSADAVRDAASRAALAPGRVQETIAVADEEKR